MEHQLCRNSISIHVAKASRHIEMTESAIIQLMPPSPAR
jgi:hypothetical protein